VMKTFIESHEVDTNSRAIKRNFFSSMLRPYVSPNAPVSRRFNVSSKLRVLFPAWPESSAATA
jgi:hypothetical protein